MAEFTILSTVNGKTPIAIVNPDGSKCRIMAVPYIAGDTQESLGKRSIQAVWASEVVNFSIPKSIVKFMDGKGNLTGVGSIQVKPRMTGKEACVVLCRMWGLTIPKAALPNVKAEKTISEAVKEVAPPVVAVKS